MKPFDPPKMTLQQVAGLANQHQVVDRPVAAMVAVDVAGLHVRPAGAPRRTRKAVLTSSPGVCGRVVAVDDDVPVALSRVGSRWRRSPVRPSPLKSPMASKSNCPPLGEVMSIASTVLPGKGANTAIWLPCVTTICW